MLLAGDIGGTKALIGLFSPAPRRPTAIDVRSFSTHAYDSLGSIVAEYFATGGAHPPIEAACFGVAGPIVEQTATLTNVPWRISAAEITERFGLDRVRLLNDLESMAYSVAVLEPDELAVIQRGERRPGGNAALIAAGTGLGEAFLHSIGGKFRPAASEGGHADFAPNGERQVELLRMLTREFGRADWEHVISGPGLTHIHRLTHGGQSCEAVGPRADAADLAAVISNAALEGRCARCVEALRIFVAAYGAEAGNLALRSLATAGVFVGGGIAPKILPALMDGTFVRAFVDKGPMRDLLALVPVQVILNPQAGLLGAAVYAGEMV